MFQEQFSTEVKPASILVDTHPAAAYYPVSKYTNLKTDAAYSNYLNTRAVVDTARGKQEGEIIAVVPCPFGTGETVCYVVSLPNEPYFNEYVPIRSVPEWNMTDCDCGKHLHDSLLCPECGLCLADCCTCTPSWLDDPEFEDYRDTGEDAAYDDYKDTRAMYRWAHGG